MTQQEQDTARYVFWCSKILGYNLMSSSARRRAKMKYAEERNPLGMPYQYGPNSVGMRSFKEMQNPCLFSSCSTTTSAQIPTMKFKVIGTEYNKENNMYAHINTQDDPTSTQRYYLTNRLDNLWWELVSKLEKQFFLSWDDPKTPEEAIQLIKDGKYTIEPNDGYRDHNWRDRFSWRTAKPDYLGYDKAQEDLRKKFQTIRDAIAVLEPAEALKMLQALEN